MVHTFVLIHLISASQIYHQNAVHTIKLKEMRAQGKFLFNPVHFSVQFFKTSCPLLIWLLFDKYPISWLNCIFIFSVAVVMEMMNHLSLVCSTWKSRCLATDNMKHSLVKGCAILFSCVLDCVQSCKQAFTTKSMQLSLISVECQNCSSLRNQGCFYICCKEH